MTTVKFLFDPRHDGVFPRPVPSGKKIPDYFKKIPPKFDPNHPQSSTVKRCMPFLDAMTQGFIIPLWADVFVRAKDGELTIMFPRLFPMESSLERHNYQQIPDHPMASMPYGKAPLKFINPWIVQTPPGYSCLFTSPLNHMETRFKILDGVVDTDEYYNNVNAPFVWTGGDGEFNIPKGTPLIQIIPFKREVYSVEYATIDDARRMQTMDALGTIMADGYKKLYRHGGKELSAVDESEFELVVEPELPEVVEPMHEQQLLAEPANDGGE
jgi:hypothetical protein